MVNQIEFNVTNAADYVETAKDETKKAVRYQSQARKVMMIVRCPIVSYLSFPLSPKVAFKRSGNIRKSVKRCK